MLFTFMLLTLLLFTFLFLTLAPVTVVAQSDLDWPTRHGPNQNGHVTGDATYPTTWNEGENENIAWKTALSGEGHSTPIIGNGRIYLTSASADGTQQFVSVVDEASGDVLERKLQFVNEDPEPLGNDINTYASPTSVLEADALYVHFGTYGTACLDPITLETKWSRRDIHCRHFRGPGSSPVIYEDLLILTFDGIDQQFVTALDKRTGETRWRTDRSTDYGDLDANGNPHRDGDLRKAYGTPAVAVVDGEAQVISIGSRAAFGYGIERGTELWTVRHDDYNAAAPPIVMGATAILNTGGRQANMIAIQLDASTRGDVTQSHQIWNRPDGNSRLAAPILSAEHLYMITDRGVIRCVNASNGEEAWAGRSSGNFVASPIIANDLLYFFNEDGDCSVVRAGVEGAKAFEIVAENHLEEGMRASPAAANGAFYLRTFHHLYKIEQSNE